MPKAQHIGAAKRLTDLPNVGPAMAADLVALGIRHPAELPGRNPQTLYEQLCRLSGVRQDPCVLDTFIALVRFADGGPPLPWWRFTEERKRRVANGEWRMANGKPTRQDARNVKNTFPRQRVMPVG
jgi:hypothetical protein